jgi:hypothetical protein
VAREEGDNNGRQPEEERANYQRQEKEKGPYFPQKPFKTI